MLSLLCVGCTSSTTSQVSSRAVVKSRDTIALELGAVVVNEMVEYVIVAESNSQKNYIVDIRIRIYLNGRLEKTVERAVKIDSFKQGYVRGSYPTQGQDTRIYADVKRLTEIQ